MFAGAKYESGYFRNYTNESDKHNIKYTSSVRITNSRYNIISLVIYFISLFKHISIIFYLIKYVVNILIHKKHLFEAPLTRTHFGRIPSFC